MKGTTRLISTITLVTTMLLLSGCVDGGFMGEHFLGNLLAFVS